MIKPFQEYIKTPIGLLGVTATDQFVMAIDFVQSKKSTRSNHITRQAAKELQEYFSAKRQKFSVPILLAGTAWQVLVWQKLLTVPHGHVISYQDLALAVGKPKAARAVGGAVNKNPLAIVVPCHRVVGSGGELVGYAGGLKKKEFLLDLERKA